MKKILVTGGQGFIGHNVVKRLEAGNTVVSYDNQTDYGFVPEDELEYLISERSARVKSTNIIGDILDARKIHDTITAYGIDTIVHLASFPRQKVVESNPALASAVMITGLINLLEASKQHRISKFVYISSSMVYGDFTNGVMEYEQCQPRGQYGIMKYMGEKLVADYARRCGMEYVIIRPSAVYGERDVEDRVVSKFILNAMQGKTLKVNGPSEVLDFSHVDDTSEGIALAVLKDNPRFDIYNITRSSDRLYTLEDAARLAIDIAGRGELEINNRDLSFPSRGRLSIGRANADLGYRPSINVEEGFLRYYEWFKNSPYWQQKLNG